MGLMTIDVTRHVVPFGLPVGTKVRATAGVLALSDHPDDKKREVRVGALAMGAIRMADMAGPRCGQHRMVEIGGHRLVVAYDTDADGLPLVVLFSIWEAVLDAGPAATSVPVQKSMVPRRLKRWLQ